MVPQSRCRRGGLHSDKYVRFALTGVAAAHRHEVGSGDQRVQMRPTSFHVETVLAEDVVESHEVLHRRPAEQVDALLENVRHRPGPAEGQAEVFQAGRDRNIELACFLLGLVEIVLDLILSSELSDLRAQLPDEAFLVVTEGESPERESRDATPAE